MNNSYIVAKLLHGVVFTRTGSQIPYLFNNETLREAGYYELLNISVRIPSFYKTICSNRMEHPYIQVMLYVLFLIHHFLNFNRKAWPLQQARKTSWFITSWGFIKDEVFRTPVRNTTQLKRWITRAVIIAHQETLQKLWKNLENRLHIIIRENGDHVEHRQFCTKTFIS